jgi:raffinose/stachyose/melibiose transport system substrate-binding protein
MKWIFLSVLIMVISITIYGIYSQLSEEQPSIYWINFKPESQKILQKLAERYQQRTGRNITIFTPETGTYSETLDKELQSSFPPTLFVVGGKDNMIKYNEYFYDLKDTKIAGELNTDNFNLYTNDKKLAAIGYCYETFGIITNIELLEKSGHELEEIKNFESLKAVVEDIHANAKTLGFDAFTSSGLHPSSSWRFSGHLTNIPLYYESRDDIWIETPTTIKCTYLNNYKNLWDLYIKNSAYSPDTLISGEYNAEEEFGKKQAVFYQNGNWEYDALVNTYGLNPEQLTMIPFYSGVKGEENAGLNSGTENYWAVNGKASQNNIDATLEFMYWMVTDLDATEILAKTFGSMPFKNAAIPENVFLAKAQQYTNEGKYTMTWAFNFTPNQDEWRKDVVTTLFEYSKNNSEENWNKVKLAFINGWEKQYKILNG